MTTLETRFEIKSWAEKPYRELPDGSRYARADVVLAGTGPQPESQTELTEASFEALLYYRADGTSTYVTFMSITGALDGRRGSLVLAGEGSYDGTSARGASRVIDATGELAGLRGTASSLSTHSDYPHMPLTLTYDLG
jgi:Protein of unknown function (DUF3224)